MDSTLTPLLSTSYLPSIRYMACLAKYRNVVIEQHETFPKQTYRNRTEIATGNGVLTLNVPVSKPNGNHTCTKDIAVSYQEPWHIRHWRAIESAYNAAPYFLYYRDGLERIILAEHNRLIDLNDELLNYLLRKLKIECSIEYSKEYRPTADEPYDFRVSLTSKKKNDGLLYPPYSQVFESRHGFKPNLSVIDLLFNMGPEARGYLMAINID